MSDRYRLGRSELRRLLDEHDISPSRALGQNFVADPNTVERIARLARVGAGDHVVEIGAGLGSLTLALAATGADIIAVEVDRYLIPVLESLVPDNVCVVHADALELNFTELLDNDTHYTLVANLPYNVATPLVMTLLEHVPMITRMIVMVQREVAERLAAVPGSRAFAGVTARRSYFADAKIVGQVSAEVFIPKPHVASSLIEIVRLKDPAVDPQVAPYGEIAALIRAGFSSRRKMLRRALSGLVDEEDFLSVGIAPTARAETIDIAAWGKLAGWKRSQLNSQTQS
ncbi:MAG TPA: 16S rRNA (adenine(1518)-N(6)/adenine(1519)-N(6))-dimethyltransferase RsmA [Acidimicrobiales bacterium]|nr:16S rRNA (adenine(1518)-N(6)/adenine(1519)-N(6))-dimethyltransferase RsmA [Acidimicrobiales bacterium]